MQPAAAQQGLSRHAGFFASLHRVEERLALEQQHHRKDEEEEEEEKGTKQPEISKDKASPLTGTITASPLLFLDPAQQPDRHTSSGPALDFLTLTKEEEEEEEEEQHPSQAEADDEQDMDIARLMALLGLSPPPPPPPLPMGVGDGCECSGGEGFLGKVVGVVGPKCDKERSRLDAWIHHWHATATEPARLAHLLLAKASAAAAPAFPATVKDFLQRDAPTLHTDD